MKTVFRTRGAMNDNESALNLSEVASDLVQEANLYAMATEDLPDLTTAEFASQLSKMLSSDTIKFFMEGGDYGRGFLSGLAIGIFMLESEVDRQLAQRQDEIGEDEEISDEDIEEIIYGGLKNGVKGGGNDGSLN